MLPEKNRPKDLNPIPEPESPTRTTKWLNRFAVFAMVVVAIGIGIFLRWSFQPSEVLRINNEPFPVRTVKDEAGKEQLVILKVDFCKLQKVEGSVRTSYFNESQETFLPIGKERADKGCVVADFPVVIPKTLVPGEYRIKFRTVYKLNPVKQEVVNEFVSQPFQVN